MSFEERMTEFAGLPVAAFPPGLDGRIRVSGDEAAAVAWRIGNDETWEADPNVESDFDEIFDYFLTRVDSTSVRALVFGLTRREEDEPDLQEALTALSRHADRFPALRALFFGDIVRSESEVSWVGGIPIGRVLEAFPNLEVLGARGDFSVDRDAEDWRLTAKPDPVAHHNLRSLTMESGGMPSGIIAGVLASDLPNLEHLEVYLGSRHYGGNATVEDFAALLAGDLFPNLRSLGLKDSEIQDDIARALAHAPIVTRLEALDLSLGVLGDEGAAALLAGQSLAHLKSLDLHHHYLSDAMMERLRSALPGVDLDLGEQNTDKARRYIAVAE